MRITKKLKSGFYRLKIGEEIYGEENGIRLVQIVGQLEDIEEKHHILSLNDLDNILTALEIIKDKGVDIFKLKECKRCKLPREYNTRSCYSRHEELTQDEFKLLKEVLL